VIDLQAVLQCAWEIQECVINQTKYPQEKHLALLGELDWREEMREYTDFLNKKKITSIASGFEVPDDAINPMLFDFQRDIVKWAIRQGRAAIFADCGLGKSFMQLEWAKVVAAETGKPVLILAPLAVSGQTVREGAKLGIPVEYRRKGEGATESIIITNYEMMDYFDASLFGGVVIDESSILKSYTGEFRNAVIEKFGTTPYKLACTATPAPNDFMELGNHSEFLGNLTRTEMLSTFFVHDGGDTAKWRLKGHAEQDFWKWIASWAVMLRNPADLGYDGSKFTLPKLHYHHHVVSSGDKLRLPGQLFAMPANTLQERRSARSASTDVRVDKVAEIVAEQPEECWMVWCNLNIESQAATKAIPGCIEVTGSDSMDYKESTLLSFVNGDIDILCSKPSIAGLGLNMQRCANVIFLGLNDSFEQFYQAVRRCWRFGQTREVHCHIVTSDLEGAVVENIQRKEAQAQEMAENMVAHMHSINEQNIRRQTRHEDEYQVKTETGNGFTAHLGDCVEGLRDVADDSIHYSIFSPPFASLYTYSASTRDMGNCRNHAEFFEQFGFLAKELYRVLMPGRLLSFHCMNLPLSKERDGIIGIKDFRGDLIRAFENVGFVEHSEVTIWKDPVTAMQRTKAIGLLHKQIVKDSCMSRQGIADYLVTMRKPGVNPERVHGRLSDYVGEEGTGPTASDPTGQSIEIWQRYASPVWMDINPSDTLQRESAREDNDERHICPLQLQVIERAMQLWTNPGDLVLSPYMGIGSEGHVAIKMKRRFVGYELKESYFKQACLNLRASRPEVGLFDAVSGD
jgi:ribosomal protein L13E